MQYNYFTYLVILLHCCFAKKTSKVLFCHACLIIIKYSI